MSAEQPTWSSADGGFDDARPGTVQVPRSFAAGLLAAAFGGGFHMVVALHAIDSHAITMESAPGAGNAAALPFVLLGSLWAGVEAGLSSTLVLHRILRWLRRPAFSDYAVGGGLIAGIIAGLGILCGSGDPHEGLAVEIGGGALAGIIYRFFAGVSRA